MDWTVVKTVVKMDGRMDGWIVINTFAKSVVKHQAKNVPDFDGWR